MPRRLLYCRRDCDWCPWPGKHRDLEKDVDCPFQAAPAAHELPIYVRSRGWVSVTGGIGVFQGGFNESYNQYLTLRGYDPSSSKLIILKRALVNSWGEPGFHRFWRVWNPGVGHLLFRLYLLLGGNRNRPISTLLVFASCGIMHDALVMLMFRRPFAAFTAVFALCGILAVINRALEPILYQEHWPRWLNALINGSCLAVSIYAAVQLQMFVFP